MTLDQVAALVGEPADELRRWRDMGLLGEAGEDPNEASWEAVERTRLVHYAAGRGIPPGEIVRISAEQGDMLEPFVRWSLPREGGVFFTRAEAAERSGLEPDLTDQVLAAGGLWDQTHVDEDDLAALEMVATAIKFGLPTDALLQSLRVLADSLGKVSEATTRLFHLHVHEVLRVQGLRGAELMAATQAVANPLADLVEPAVLYFHRKSWERANREDLILHLQEESIAPGEFVRTLLFVDISGYTAMTESIGDAAVARVVDRFAGLVRHTASECSGEVVKQIGDEFMLVFPDPAAAVTFGTTITARARRDLTLPPLRIGAHSGSVLYREGDYYGATVNLAARVTSVARGGQFVVTAIVRKQALGDSRSFKALGEHVLKGIGEPIALFEVTAP